MDKTTKHDDQGFFVYPALSKLRNYNNFNIIILFEEKWHASYTTCIMHHSTYVHPLYYTSDLLVFGFTAAS